MEVGFALSVVYKDCFSYFWMCTSGKFNQSGLRKLSSTGSRISSL